MTDKGTIKIPREDFERHNQRRKDLGLTWLEYIDGEAPEGIDTAVESLSEQIRDIRAADAEDLTPLDDVDGSDLAAIREQLDRIESSAETAEQRAGSIERMLEGMR